MYGEKLVGKPKRFVHPCSIVIFNVDKTKVGEEELKEVSGDLILIKKSFQEVVR